MESDAPRLVVAGYARLFGDLLDDGVLAELRKIGESPDNQWAAVFIYDRDDDGSYSKWTLFTTDYRYAETLAMGTGRVDPRAELIRDRFPAYQPGWVIDDGQD